MGPGSDFAELKVDPLNADVVYDANVVTWKSVDGGRNWNAFRVSTDTLYKIGAVNIPLYCIRPQQILSPAKGSHRWLWDMRYAPLNVPASYPISAIYRNTAPVETAPFVMFGNYTVKLTVDGKTYSQSLVIKMDPQVKTPLKSLQQQHDLSVQVYEIRQQLRRLLNEIATAKEAGLSATKEKGLEALFAPAPERLGLQQIDGSLASLFNILQESDEPPTKQAAEGVTKVLKDFKRLSNLWKVLTME